MFSPSCLLHKLETKRNDPTSPQFPHLMTPPTPSSNAASQEHTISEPSDADEEAALGIRRTGLFPADHGGSSDIWKAEMTKGDGTSVVVALKVLRLTVSEERLRKREEREMTWITLDHENVAPLFCIFRQPNGAPVFVSPWFANGTVDIYLGLHSTINPMKIICEIASGVDYLHSRGIVHGDLKGSNVMVEDDGHARLIDFGLCRFTNSESGLTTSTSSTTRWCAPELLHSSNTRPTMSGDVYAFASTVLQLLTKELPYGTLNERLVPLQVLSYVTPRSFASGFQYNIPRASELWDLLDECWEQVPNRISIREVRSRLSYFYL